MYTVTLNTSQAVMMESPLVCPDRDLSPVGGDFHSAWLELAET